MARLILEEGGEIRRFKLSQGKLTFGSGDKATLTLASEDVAALHGQIEMGDDGAVLRVAKGVMPPKIGGRPVQGAHVFKEGEVVSIGSSRLSVEYDEGEGPAGAAGAVAARPTGRTGARATGRTGAARSGGQVERKRPKAQRSGIPGWLTAVLVLAVIGGLGYAILGKTADSMGNNFDFDVRFSQYERVKDEDPGAARKQLIEIQKQELTPAQEAKVENEFLLLGDRLASLDDAARNAEASNYLKMRIFDYAEKFDVNEDRSYARLFVKRAEKFMKDYPTHPDLARVERLMRRAKIAAVESEPAVFRDLEVEVKGFTGAKPMDFPTAFAAIDRFIAETNDTEAIAQAEQLRAETRQAELEFFEAQLDLAAIVYDRSKYPDKFDPSRAVADMIVIITSVENPEFKADAARRITGITEIDASFLRGYKRQRPDTWDEMMKVPALLEFAKANGLEE
ncbi:hypothetical protein [Planctomycetes bacterium Poly30]